MNSLAQEEPVFETSLEKGGNAKIVYKAKNFRLVSHKLVHTKTDKPIRDIVLSPVEMLSLCKLLPVVHQTMLSTAPGAESKDIIDFVVSTEKNCVTKLLLNSFESKNYIWVRKFLQDKVDRNILYPCQGGTILNDVVPEQLNDWVQKCITV